MHCGRYIHARAFATRDALRCANGFGARGAGRAAGRSGLRRRRDRQRAKHRLRTSPLAPRPSAFSGQGQERHLSVHGWRAVAGRHVRSQAAARSRAWPADQDEGRSRRSSTMSARCCSRPGSSANTARAAFRSAICFRTSPTCVDDLAIVRSMVANFSEHTNANYFIHSGNGQQGRPSMGAWVTYGLGSECQDLPGFVVLNSGMIPPGGLDCFSSGFLPATLSRFARFSAASSPSPISRRRSRAERRSAASSLCMRAARPGVLGRHGAETTSSKSAIANYELAFRMQTAVPDLMDLAGETRGHASAVWPRRSEPTEMFGRQCLRRAAAGRARRAVRRTAVPERRRTIAGTSTAT